MMNVDNPESRFFIDHGVVHDRKTGKHVRCGCFPYEGTVEDFLKLLHELEASATPNRKLVGYVTKRNTFISAEQYQYRLDNRGVNADWENSAKYTEQLYTIPVYADL